MEAGSVDISSSPKTPLPEVAFAVATGMNWLLGRGVYIVKGYAREDGKDLKVILRAGTDPKPLLFSNVATIRELVLSGYLPKDLAAHERIGLGENKVRDGNNRVGSSSANGTVKEAHDLIPEANLGSLAFGTSDQFVEFFCLGAGAVEWRGSMTINQHWFNIGLTKPELDKFSANPLCYQPVWTAAHIIEAQKNCHKRS
jgi:hypothetical protein